MKLVEDLQILKPTFFPIVPKLMLRILEKVDMKIKKKPAILRSLVNAGINTKLKNLYKNGTCSHWFYDKVVFKKMKNNIGGCVRIMCTGSAPIDKNVLNRFKVIFGVNVKEG